MSVSDMRRTLGLKVPLVLAATVAGGLPPAARPITAADELPSFAGEQLSRVIPRSGERLPAVGMGTWITFNVGNNQAARAARLEVLKAFFANGGGLIDSSPMYGSAQAVVGDLLGRLNHPKTLFAATKVWTRSAPEGVAQIETARALWGLERFDLYQVHNLLNWQAHLPHLQALVEAGSLRYAGLTTSHGRRHDDLLELMQRTPLDFVQLTYNPLDREAEARLLPMALDKGIAIIVNRPFRRGQLIDALAGEPLPAVAAELQCESWAQLLLKWVLSHPAVTCVIPATTQVAHMEQNMAAGRGRLPDAAERELIARAVTSA